jgi:hypothetical protein
LISTLDGGEWSNSRPGERAPSSYWTGDWVGPIADLDAAEEIAISCPYRESNPGRPACSRSLYTLSYLDAWPTKGPEFNTVLW